MPISGAFRAIRPYICRLGAKDSNLYQLIQSQSSCHWTSPQKMQRAVF